MPAYARARPVPRAAPLAGFEKSDLMGDAPASRPRHQRSYSWCMNSRQQQISLSDKCSE